MVIRLCNIFSVLLSLNEERSLSSPVTVLLEAHRNGDDSAFNSLATLLYPELKSLAKRRAAGSAGSGATTLVHETFLRLLSGGELKTEDRREFFALASTVMRRVVIDEVRYVTAEKRARNEVTLANTFIGDDGHEKAEFLLQVDEMLGILEQEDERLVRVFECRYFGGLTTAETAEALEMSNRTVERAWSEVRSRIADLIDNA